MNRPKRECSSFLPEETVIEIAEDADDTITDQTFTTLPSASNQIKNPLESCTTRDGKEFFFESTCSSNSPKTKRSQKKNNDVIIIDASIQETDNSQRANKEMEDTSQGGPKKKKSKAIGFNGDNNNNKKKKKKKKKKEKLGRKAENDNAVVILMISSDDEGQCTGDSKYHNHNGPVIAKNCDEELNISEKIPIPSQKENHNLKRKAAASVEVIDIESITTGGNADVAQEYSVVRLILDVFPDCEIDHIITISKHFGIDNARSPCKNSGKVNTILEHLADHKYPKDTKYYNTATQKHLRDYESTSWKTSDTYRREAEELLSNDFPFLTIDAINCLLMASKYHYTQTYKVIYDAVIQSKGHNGNRKIMDGLNEIENAACTTVAFMRGKEILMAHVESLEKLIANGPVHKKLAEIIMTKARVKNKRTKITDNVLLHEVKLDEQRKREIFEYTDAIVARKVARECAKKTKSTMECGCCFAEYAFEEMCQCKDGHLFCVDCLRKYAEEQIFGQNKTELCCMWNESSKSCNMGYDDEQLNKALPPKVIQKYEEARFHAAVEKANIADLCKCPKCEYQAILPESENIFQCPNTDCGYNSCRLCGEPPHIPLKCDEVEKEKQTNARTRVEEAMTKARLRECPKCKKHFYKVDGCNKIACSCGTKVCYVCRKMVSAYSHFCQTPHCKHESCGKCSLYTDSIVDDRRAMKEAGLSELRSVVAKEKDASVAEKVNVDDLLEGNDKKVPGKGAWNFPVEPRPARAQLPPAPVRAQPLPQLIGGRPPPPPVRAQGVARKIHLGQADLFTIPPPNVYQQDLEQIIVPNIGNANGGNIAVAASQEPHIAEMHPQLHNSTAVEKTRHPTSNNAARQIADDNSIHEKKNEENTSKASAVDKYSDRKRPAIPIPESSSSSIPSSDQSYRCRHPQPGARLEPPRRNTNTFAERKVDTSTTTWQNKKRQPTNNEMNRKRAYIHHFDPAPYMRTSFRSECELSPRASRNSPIRCRSPSRSSGHSSSHYIHPLPPRHNPFRPDRAPSHSSRGSTLSRYTPRHRRDLVQPDRMPSGRYPHIGDGGRAFNKPDHVLPYSHFSPSNLDRCVRNFVRPGFIPFPHNMVPPGNPPIHVSPNERERIAEEAFQRGYQRGAKIQANNTQSQRSLPPHVRSNRPDENRSWNRNKSNHSKQGDRDTR